MTPKQQQFVKEYLIDLNATQAAIRAGYSEATAYSIGQRLLKDVEVSSAIQTEMGKRAERTLLTADEVLKRLDRIAQAAEQDNDRGAAIKANELLGKYFKLFTDKVEQSGNVSVTILTGVPDEADQS